MGIRLYKGTNRNTQAHIVEFGLYTLYFSYETCIALRSPFGRFRRDNIWGPTTGRHINEMDVRDFPVVDSELFKQSVDSIGTGNEERTFLAMKEPAEVQKEAS